MVTGPQVGGILRPGGVIEGPFEAGSDNVLTILDEMEMRNRRSPPIMMHGLGSPLDLNRSRGGFQGGLTVSPDPGRYWGFRKGVEGSPEHAPQGHRQIFSVDFPPVFPRGGSYQCTRVLKSPAGGAGASPLLPVSQPGPGSRRWSDTPERSGCTPVTFLGPR